MSVRALALAAGLLLAAGCGSDGGNAEPDAGTQPITDLNPCLGPADAGVRAPDAFADRIVSFTPGEGAGFGQDLCPGIVLGSPEGMGTGNGSLHTLSLGAGGSIVLELTDLAAVDGPGVDLLVFENAFARSGTGATFAEPGRVAVSEDGVAWSELPCAAADEAHGYPGCAGVKPVFASSTNGISATDPEAAGGDGFDLDALAVVNGEALP